jgi:hypothetical protein
MLTKYFTTDPIVTVVIGTYGADEWKHRAATLATEVFETQTFTPEIVWAHRDSLAEARNTGAEAAKGDWLVFLDADDKLEADFCSWIDYYRRHDALQADVFQTCVMGFNTEGFIEDAPVLIPQKYPLIHGNYLTIGSPVRREKFLEVGGFDEWPMLEDWALWLKCEKAGALFSSMPEAVYYINDDHERNVSAQDYKIAQSIRRTYK